MCRSRHIDLVLVFSATCRLSELQLPVHIVASWDQESSLHVVLELRAKNQIPVTT